MILVTGDTHRHIDTEKIKQIDQTNMTKADFLIVAGDFGANWFGSERDKEIYDFYAAQKFTTLFVDGNHDRPMEKSEYAVGVWRGGKVQFLTPHIIHLMRGQVFCINGKTFFIMGGASSIDQEWRTEGISWWPEEIPTREEFDEGLDNLDKVNWKVDYVITHTGPSSIADQLARIDKKDAVSQYLEVVREKLDFNLWCFGHFHEDKDMDNNFLAVYNDIIYINTRR